MLAVALTHRDYFTSHEFIQIKIYDDRIWFFNPGGLPGDITIEDLKKTPQGTST
jgi:ATP-dependent DNA helicase RecG